MSRRQRVVFAASLAALVTILVLGFSPDRAGDGSQPLSPMTVAPAVGYEGTP